MNTGAPIRTALIAAPAVASRLGVWDGDPSVHTRDAPEDAPYPMIICSEDIAVGDMDGLTSRRPIVVRDIRIYGVKPDHERVVDELGWIVRDLFHRERFAISVEGHQVIDIVCAGPIPAPVTDVQNIGRLVTLSLWLKKLAA